MKGGTIWFTGLACAGKTTIAKRIKEILLEKSMVITVLDSDELRQTVSKNFGYTIEERDKHMRFVSEICHLLTLQGVLNLAAVISPTEIVRKEVRGKIDNFMEVYIKCPLEVCKQRDVKGHYHEFEEGKLKDFIGLDLPYEEPEGADLIVETDKEDVDTCANKIIDKIKELGFYE
jgi:adenylylsulfate kinase